MPHGLFMRFDDISNGEKGKSVHSCTKLNLALIDWSVFIMDVMQLIAIAISWLDNSQEKDMHHDDGHFGPLSTANLEWLQNLDNLRE